MQFSNPSQARGVAALFTLARTFTAGMPLSQMGGAEPFALMTMVLFTNAPVVDGRDITIRSGVLDVSGIARDASRKNLTEVLKESHVKFLP
jgi:hypothetical protein